MRVVVLLMGVFVAFGVMGVGQLVSAQTVPAEEWVGPLPVQARGTLTRAQVVAELEAAQRQPQATAEAWVGAAADAGVRVGALRRAEVQADLALAQRSGLLAMQAREGYDPASPDAMAAQMHYRQLRDGVAFQREVERIEGREEAHLAGSGQRSDWRD